MDDQTFICACSSTEHQVRFLFFDFEYENGRHDKEIIGEIHLDPVAGFWRRIWIGIKYIFKFSHVGGHWCEFIVKEEDAKRMVEFLKQIEK